jgi:hypothetical protein
MSKNDLHRIYELNLILFLAFSSPYHFGTANPGYPQRLTLPELIGNPYNGY